MNVSTNTNAPAYIKNAIDHIKTNFNYGTTAVKKKKDEYGDALIAVTLRGASNTISRQLKLCPHLDSSKQKSLLIKGAKDHTIDGAKALPEAEINHINDIRKPLDELENQPAVGCPAALAGVLGSLIEKAISYKAKNPKDDPFFSGLHDIFESSIK